MAIPFTASPFEQGKASTYNNPAEQSCDRYQIPWSDKNRPSSDADGLVSCGPFTSRVDDCRHVDICGYRSSRSNCDFQVVVERGPLFKQLRFAATTRVEVRQQFDAFTGDQLSYDYVLLLKSGENRRPVSSLVNARLIHLESQCSYSQLDCIINGHDSASNRRVASDARQSIQFAIPAEGRYELRFMTAVDPDDPGASAHLLVDALTVSRASRAQVALASIACVGCCRRNVLV